MRWGCASRGLLAFALVVGGVSTSHPAAAVPSSEDSFLVLAQLNDADGIVLQEMACTVNLHAVNPVQFSGSTSCVVEAGDPGQRPNLASHVFTQHPIPLSGQDHSCSACLSVSSGLTCVLCAPQQSDQVIIFPVLYPYPFPPGQGGVDCQGLQPGDGCHFSRDPGTGGWRVTAHLVINDSL